MHNNNNAARGILPLISSLLLIFLVIKASAHRWIFETFLFVNLLLATTLFHACDEYGACALSFNVLLGSDLFFSGIALSAVSLRYLIPPFARLVGNLVAIELIFLIVVLENSGGGRIAILVCYEILALIFIVERAWHKDGHDHALLLSSLVLIVAPMGSFFLPFFSRKCNWITHSVVHFATLGILLWCLLLTRTFHRSPREKQSPLPPRPPIVVPASLKEEDLIPLTELSWSSDEDEEYK